MDFITIDFEASCLPRHGRSYPIEVAVSGAGIRKSWIIKPDPQWRNWDWTDEAASLHGLSKDILDRFGLPPKSVLSELVAAIAGKRVYSDSYLDGDWWAILAQAAGATTPSPIEHVSAFLDDAQASAVRIATAMHSADHHWPERHRAGADAAWLWHVLNMLELSRHEQLPLKRAA